MAPFLVLVVLAAAAALYGFSRLLTMDGPARYALASPGEIEPFIRSWGEWLDAHGRIVLRHPPTGAAAEFRKERYRSGPDILRFRFRNADTNRVHFARVRAAFETARTPFSVDLARRRRGPRALTVALQVGNVYTPVAAARLALLAVAALAPGQPFAAEVLCEGRLRARSDAPAVRMIPDTEARRRGYRFGLRLARAVRWLRGG